MKIALLAFVVCLSVSAFSQTDSKNKFGMTLAYGGTQGPLGIGSSTPQGHTTELGINYYRTLLPKLKFETGLAWVDYRFITLVGGEPFGRNVKYNVGLLYVPIMLRSNFSKYFYMNYGFLADLDLRYDKSIVNQSGLGFAFGLGFEIPLSGKLALQLGIVINKHSAWLTKEDQNYPGMLNPAVRIGVRMW